MATTATKRKSTPAKVPSTLSHLIPEMVFADEYISRQIEGWWDIDLLRYADEANVNTLVFGPTGPGKTSLIMAYAAVEKRPLVTVQCNGGVDPNTFWGGLALNEDGSMKGWQDSEITLVIKQGGVLYLDEVNFLHPKVAAVFHGLLDKRRQITIQDRGNEVVKAHKDLQVICAYNPDYEGTRPLNPAFKNRFKLKVEFDYNEAVERELLCVPVMLDVAARLRASHKAGDLETPVSTNMLIEFEELAVDLGYGFALLNFLNAFGEDERSSVKEAMEMFSEDIVKQVQKMEEEGKTA